MFYCQVLAVASFKKNAALSDNVHYNLKLFSQLIPKWNTWSWALYKEPTISQDKTVSTDLNLCIRFSNGPLNSCSPYTNHSLKKEKRLFI